MHYGNNQVDKLQYSPERTKKRSDWEQWQERLDRSGSELRHKQVKRVVQEAENERGERIQLLNYYAELREKKDEFEIVFTRQDLDLKLGVNEFGHCCVM